MLSLRNANELPEFQMVELASGPTWIVEAHDESMDSTSLMLANDSQQHDIQHAYYCLQVSGTVCNTRDSGNEDISGDDLPLAISNFDVDVQNKGLGLAAAEAESPIRYITGNESIDVDSPALHFDYARWTMKQFEQIGVAVKPALKEVASLEADNSMHMSAMEPENSMRAACLPDPTGYAVLGKQMDCDLSMDAGKAAALMDSLDEHGANIDLDSSDNDHQIDNESVCRLKEHYVTDMDKDARIFVTLYPTADSNSTGNLMLSINADKANPAVHSNFH